MPLEDHLRCVQEGDERSLRALMEEYAPMVHGIALRITGSEAVAADIVQEVFIGLPDALGRFDGRNFPGWLTTIATRYALMCLRAEKRRRAIESKPQWPVSVSSEEGVVLGRLDLEAALRELQEDLRSVFLLKEVQGLSHREVAAILEISVDLSRVRLFRARQFLLARLEP